MMDITQYRAERIAHRSTQGEGRFAKPRWTELAVYFCHDVPPGGARWTAEVVGRSTVEGEKDRRSTLSAAKLSLALEHFDQSAPAQSVKDQAWDWLVMHPDAEKIDHLMPGDELLLTERAPFSSDAEALDWLYGEGASEQRGLATRVAADFDLPSESSVRMALKNGSGIRVPLATVARFIDLRAFRQAIEKGADHGQG